MSALGNRLTKLETRAKPNGGVIVATYWDEADDEKLAQVAPWASDQSAILVVIQKFGPRPVFVEKGEQ